MLFIKSSQPSGDDRDSSTHSLDKTTVEKSIRCLKEKTRSSGGSPKVLIPTGHRRRAFSLKLLSRSRSKLLGCTIISADACSTQMDTTLGRKPSSCAGNEADVESNQEADETAVRWTSRQRSASLSLDFCPSPSTASVAISPLETIKHFKEAKMRGVTDPEVFADYQIKQLASSGQQLSPTLNGSSKWVKRLPLMHDVVSRNEDEDDRGVKDEDAEFCGSYLIMLLRQIRGCCNF